MKTTQKNMPKIIALLFLLACFINCTEKKKQDPKPDEEHPGTPVVVKPGDVITLDEARTLYTTYDDRRVGIIQDYEDAINRNNGVSKKFDVARYVKFDYEIIKQYIAYVEQEAKEAEVDITSFRIYFANNPEADESLIHPRQNSVMLSPTTTQQGEESLFYIDDSEKETPKAVLLNYDFTPKESGKTGGTLPGDKTNQASAIPNLMLTRPNAKLAPFQEGKSLTLNRGNSAPPPPIN